MDIQVKKLILSLPDLFGFVGLRPSFQKEVFKVWCCVYVT